jgi:hypothetical protein
MSIGNINICENTYFQVTQKKRLQTMGFCDAYRSFWIYYAVLNLQAA